MNLFKKRYVVRPAALNGVLLDEIPELPWSRFWTKRQAIWHAWDLDSVAVILRARHNYIVWDTVLNEKVWP